MARIINGKKYYPVSERILFGLESMRDKAEYMAECEADNLTLDQLKKWADLAEECGRLHSYAMRTGHLSGRDYGRAKAITTQREWMRYNACIAVGMGERDAGACFR